MRKIEFRGKRFDGTWIHGFYRAIKWNPNKATHYICNGNSQFEVDPETVGQYTGLKDKNGKDIYEGDIIAINWKVPTEKCEAEILWSNEEFGWNYVSFGCKRPGNPLLELTEEKQEFEVIGNIHET